MIEKELIEEDKDNLLLLIMIEEEIMMIEVEEVMMKEVEEVMNNLEIIEEIVLINVDLEIILASNNLIQDLINYVLQVR